MDHSARLYESAALFSYESELSTAKSLRIPPTDVGVVGLCGVYNFLLVVSPFASLKRYGAVGSGVICAACAKGE